MCKNEKNMVLNQSPEALKNRSDFGACYYNSWRWRVKEILSEKLLLVFRCFTKILYSFGVVFLAH